MVVVREFYIFFFDRVCIYLEFDISNMGFMYEIGDYVGVFVENLSEDVEEVVWFLGVDCDVIFFFMWMLR